MKNLLWILFGVSIAAFAQQVGVVVAEPKVASVLDQISAHIPKDGQGLAILVFILGGVIDIPMRLWKTQKPHDLMSYVGRVLFALGNLCLALSSVIDKVIPQNSVEPKAK